MNNTITQNSGSENIDRKSLRRASFMRSPEKTEGESNIHINANPLSHSIAVAATDASKNLINGSGATAAKARCAARAYLEMNFCT